MNLVSVYALQHDHAAVNFLYALLAEREPHECISHRQMPTFAEHVAFVRSVPYPAWYLLEQGGERVGAAYLTLQREIGVAIAKEFRGRGLATRALSALMRQHKGGRFLANINPANATSIALFRKHGFGGPIQITLEKS